MTRRLLAPAALLCGALLLHGCTDAGTSAPSITMPTAATHARFFPIAPGDAHALGSGTPAIACNSCHQDKLTGLPTASFTAFTCTGCHVAAPAVLHDDVAALTTFHQASAAVAAIFARTGQPFDTHDQACRACHPQGIRDGVDHDLHFPLPHGDRAGLVVARCSDCHVSRGTGNYLVMGCAPCHARTAPVGTRHVGVVDFVDLPAGATQAQQDAASAACVRCHGDGVVAVRVVGHAAAAQGFPIGGGAVHDGASASCFACHPALGANPGRPLAGDFKVATCVGCHTALVGPANLAHDDRAALEPYHLALVDQTTTPPTPIAKARLFTQVVDAAVVAAGGDAARGLSAACLQCHPQGMGGHPYFVLPHQNAARTVVASCQQCHVTPGRRSDLGCAACHATSSPVGSRHAKVPDVVAADTSLAASAKCARCHENDAIPVRVASHGPFAIASGSHSGPAGGACLACHTASKGEPTPWAADFKQASCVGCHVPVAGGTAQHDDWASLRPIHAGVALYPATQPTAAAFSAACLQCHPTGTSGLPANHGDYFSVAAGSKHAFPGPRITTCLDCHTSASRLDPTQFRCAACHASDAVPLATGHAKVPDFAADPQNPVRCLSCHADGRLPATAARITVTVAGHGVAASGFTIGAGAHAGAAGASCLTCHPANRAPSTTPPHWEYARDWRQVNCVGCHVAVAGGRAQHDDRSLATGQVTLAALHASTASFTTTVASMGLSAACVYCHADGAGGAPANHPLLFPIAAGTKHAGIACGACHTNPADRKDLAAFACASCHAGLPATATRKAWATAHTLTGYTITSYLTASSAGGTTTTVPIDMTRPAGCLRCHANSQVDRVAGHPLGSSAFGKERHRTAGCLTCHWRLRTDKPWGANFSQASGTAGPPPTACYVCHASGSG
jgi:cytochrome c554/c'-like protein